MSRLPLSAIASFVFLLSFSTQAQTFGVFREVYTGISGTGLADLTSSPSYPGNPTFAEVLTGGFEAPTDVDDNYGQRLRAYVIAPQTGSYIFWIASDDNSVLYLSTDDSPANVQLIASVPGWTNSRIWDKYPEQESAPRTLQAGQKYYIEALMKEGGGGDNLAVRWQLPNSTIQTPIPNSQLEAFGLGPPEITQQPASTSVLEGQAATFSVQLLQSFGATYQWQRDRANIPGATQSTYTLFPVGLSDNNTQYRCIIVNGYGSITSSEATLTVQADTTRPTILSVSSLGNPTGVVVLYSEPVEAASALNPDHYLLNNGASVIAAGFAGDQQSVLLETSSLTPGQAYTLTVNNVRDQATAPNTIAANTQRSFSFDYTPFDIGLIKGASEPLGPSRRRSGLAITEIMYNPAARVDGRNIEFVEVYNSEEVALDVGGFRLSGTIDFTIPEGTTIPSRGFLVIAPNPADFQAVYGISGVLGGFSDALSNGGGVLRLRHRLNAILCEVEYSDDPPWPVAADGAGHSLVLARPSYGENDVRAWFPSHYAGGSPGAQEPSAPTAYRSVLINEVLTHTDDPLLDFVELFNYSGSSVDISGCILTDDPSLDRFVVPPGTQLTAKGHVFFDQLELGFALSAAGETVFLKTPDGSRVIDAVEFSPQANGVSWGRSPDGAVDFSELNVATPGTANALLLRRKVVINEIMYHPPSGDDDDEFVEIYNYGTGAVDLSGWRVRGGIEYEFPDGAQLPAAGYVVVAKSGVQLAANYPHLTTNDVYGDYSGSLGNGGDTIRLTMPEDLVVTNNTVVVTNTVHITVDEVAYRDGGRWGTWSDGGGSSLELVDPRSDNRWAANWADSDETGKGQWVTVEHTGRLDNGRGAIDELHAMILRKGECLLDDVEVIAGGPNLISNGTFESGIDDWIIQGNHVRSGWSQSGEGYSSQRSLHLRASAGGDNGANRVEIDLANSLAENSTATIRAKARWVRGHPDLLLRFHGNHLEALGTLPIPSNLGTPGQPNGQALANTGPAIRDVMHEPVLPANNQAVTVTARVEDPDGLANLVVKYRLDPATNIYVVAMQYRGAGLFAATLPGRPSGTLLAFHVEATDAAPSPLVSQFPRDPARGECLIRYGDPTPSGNFGIYRMWMTEENIQTWTQREKLSNEPLDGTLVYGGSRVVYNAGARFRGSPFIRPSYNSPVGSLSAYVWTLPKDEPVLASDEFNLDTLEPGKDDTRQREKVSFWIGEQLGISFTYQRWIVLYFNGTRRGEVYADVHQPNSDYVQAWFPSDDRGEIYKIDDWFEFNDSVGREFNENARLQNYTTTGGAKKKARYRWSWEKKSNRGLDDDHSSLFTLVDALNTADPAQYTADVASLVDIDQWMRVFATRRIVADWDGYSYSRGKNQFAYKPEQGQWKMMLWDLDFSLGGGSRSATQGLFEQVNDPTIQTMYANPTFVRAYWRAMHDAVYGPLQSSVVNPVMDAYYAAFQSNGISVAGPSAVKSWITDRRNFIVSQLNTVAASFAVTSNNGNNFTSPVNLVTLSGTAPVNVHTIKINGVAYPATWTSVNGWEIEIALGPGSNALSLEGYDYFGQLISGLTDTITVTYTGATEDPADYLVINEIMYNAAVPDAAFVEIHNRATANAFDLSNYRLDGADFLFPEGAVIEPGGFMVVANNSAAYLDAYGSTESVVGVMNGRLDNGGETLRLIELGATPAEDAIIDEVSYEDDPPWPALADGFGPSLQLVDPSLDNNRVAHWAAVQDSGGGGGSSVLVDFADVWRYEDTGTDLGTSWRTSGYNDSSWLAGAGLIAVENSALPEPINTVPTHGATTFYFRNNFNFTGNPGATALEIETIIDDGAIVYLNNVEVLRLGMPSGAATYDTFASRTVSNATREGPFSISSAPLQVGDNVLAVEVHQVNSGSSDIVLGARLTATSTEGLPYTPGARNSVAGALTPLPDLWLNEVQPVNVTGLQDGAGDIDPWVELYNGGSTALDLNDFYLTDDYAVPTKWRFPSGSTIAPGEFLVVWADGEPGESTGSEFHTDFRIATYDGSLALVEVGEDRMVDYLNYGVLANDRSYGAYPDGTPAKRMAFYYPTPGAVNTSAYPEAPVHINEWMAANTTTIFDPADGSFDDWFELYNEGPGVVDLSGYTLTDDLTNPDQWAIPEGTILQPGEFLLVWADNETDQNLAGNGDLHVGFRLSIDGEDLGLFAPNGDPIDTLSFGLQTADLSRGLWPDGNASVIDLPAPTPGASNTGNTDPNIAPVVGPVSDQTVPENSALQLTIPATDANADQVLSFTLGSGAPSGAVINSTSGLLTWTPSEAQGPNTYLLTVNVLDNGSPPLGDSVSFQVAVPEVNTAPSLVPIGDQSVDEGQTLEFVAVGSDDDLPKQSLVYSLDAGAPTGANIDAISGLFRWSPGETDGPGSYPVTVIVFDSGNPSLNAADTFTIEVREVNAAPILAAIGPRSVDEEQTLSFTVLGVDADVPAQNLTYSLDAGAPAEATLDPNTGAFSWRPDETDGPAVHSITFRVTDDARDLLSDSEMVQITVREVNSAPTLSAVGPQSVDEGQSLSFTLQGQDDDLPAQNLTYSMDGAPTGATLDPDTGAFSWQPTEQDGPDVHSMTFRVTDDLGLESNLETVSITVAEVNQAPTINPIADRQVALGATLTLTVAAQDADEPANTLSFELQPGAPAGAAIDADTGELQWTPTAGQAGQQYSITVQVTDNGSPSLSATETFSVGVNEEGDVELVEIVYLGADTLRLTWSSTDTDTYELQAKDGLDQAAWEVVSQYPGTAGTTTVEIPIAGRPQRFYQIVRVQP